MLATPESEAHRLRRAVIEVKDEVSVVYLISSGANIAGRKTKFDEVRANLAR